MKNAVRNKLHSQSGTSLLIALLFFLTALTVGAVVLTAAVTNAGRTERNRQEQQAYLAVSSAAMLVKEELRGMTFTARYQTVTAPDGEGNPQTSVTAPETALSGGGGLLAGRPEDDLVNFYYSTTADLQELAPGGMIPGKTAYALKIEAENLPEVAGRMEIDQTDTGRYTITVILYTGTEAMPVNTTTLLFTPTVSNTRATTVDSSEEIETTTYTTAVTWGAPVITKGETV